MGPFSQVYLALREYIDQGIHQLISNHHQHELYKDYMNMKVTVNFILVNSNIDSLSAELIDAFRLAHEHNLELCPLRVVVNILGKFAVNSIFLNRDVDCNALL